MAAKGKEKVKSGFGQLILSNEEVKAYLRHFENQEALLPHIKEAYQQCDFVNPTTERPEGVSGGDPFKYAKDQITLIRDTLLTAQSNDSHKDPRVYPSQILHHCHEVDELIIGMAAAAFGGKGYTEFFEKFEKRAAFSRGGKTGAKTRAESDPDGAKAYVRQRAEKLRKAGTKKTSWAKIILTTMQNDPEYHGCCPSVPTIRAWYKTIADKVDKR